MSTAPAPIPTPAPFAIDTAAEREQRRLELLALPELAIWASDGPWCAECEEVRIRCGGDWNDESEAFAKIKLLCGGCWDRLKELNGF